MYGPPGTGKTLFAKVSKAISVHIDITFHSLDPNVWSLSLKVLFGHIFDEVYSDDYTRMIILIYSDKYSIRCSLHYDF